MGSEDENGTVLPTHPDRLEEDELRVSVGQVQRHALQRARQLAL